MFSKRNLTYIGSIMMIVLFAVGITVMAAGLTDLPSIPSNTTPAATAALTDSAVVLTTDATSGATVTTDATGATVATVAQATAAKPDDDDDDEDDEDFEDDDRIIDPSIQLISRDAAVAIAMAKVGNGTVVEIELHGNDNPPLYEIKLIAGNYKYELKLHAVTGALLDLEKEEVESSDDSDDDD